MSDTARVPEGWVGARFAARPDNLRGAPVAEGDLALIQVAPRHAAVIEARVLGEIQDDDGFLLMGPIVRWVRESPELGASVQANADLATTETDRAFKEAVRRCGELFFHLPPAADGARPSVGVMDVNGHPMLHAYADLGTAMQHHPGEPVAGVPAAQVYRWVLDNPDLAGLVVRCHNLNQAWAALSRTGVEEVVASLPPPDVQHMIDGLWDDEPR